MEYLYNVVEIPHYNVCVRILTESACLWNIKFCIRWLQSLRATKRPLNNHKKVYSKVNFNHRNYNLTIPYILISSGRTTVDTRIYFIMHAIWRWIAAIIRQSLLLIFNQQASIHIPLYTQAQLQFGKFLRQRC